MWELQPKPELSVVFLNPLSLSARQRHQGFSSACSYSLHLHLGIAESRNFHQGSLASRWSLHILWAPRGNSEKPEEGVWAFSLYFCKGQICHMDTWVLTTAHMCLYREHLHGHPNWTTCPGVFPPVLAEHKSITYQKTQKPMDKSTLLAKLLKVMAAGCPGDHKTRSGWGTWETAGSHLSCISFHGKCVHRIRRVTACVLGDEAVGDWKNTCKTANYCWWALPICKGLLSEDLSCLLPRQALVS